MLQFGSQVREIRNVFEGISDARNAKKVRFPLVDVACAGLAMMFWQDPGLLPFQQRLQDRTGSNNLETMFRVRSVPKETQFRKLLDPIEPEKLLAGLRRGITLLQSTRSWLAFRTLEGHFLFALDAT